MKLLKGDRPVTKEPRAEKAEALDQWADRVDAGDLVEVDAATLKHDRRLTDRKDVIYSAAKAPDPRSASGE